MIGGVNPLDAPEAWDICTIVGINTPGRCKVSGFKREVEWDVKTGKGTSGATETVKGLPPAKGSVKFWAWKTSHFAAWDVLLPQLKYDPTKKTKQANAIYHPALADLDIDSVNIEAISLWEEEGSGEYSRTIDMLEFAPSAKRSATATPTGADYTSKDKKATPGSHPDAAVEALQKEAADLTAKAQKAFG